MAIRVTGGIASTSVSAVKLRAGVAAIHPVTSVQYTIAAADTSYILLTASAALDTTGRYKYLTELVLMSDGVAWTLAKGAQDAVTVDDTSSLVFGKSLADSVALADVIQTVLIFLRDVADTTTLSDSQLLSVAKALTDAAATSDTATLAFSSSQADAIALVEATAISLAKTFADTFSVSDETAFALDRTVQDVVAAADDVALLVGKAFDDAQAVLDALTLDSAKALTDGVGLNESFAFEYSLASTIDNVVFAQDVAALSVSRAYSDAVSFTDGGYILSQDYCDLSYFAQDYVGSAQIF